MRPVDAAREFPFCDSCPLLHKLILSRWCLWLGTIARALLASGSASRSRVVIVDDDLIITAFFPSFIEEFSSTSLAFPESDRERDENMFSVKIPTSTKTVNRPRGALFPRFSRF